MKHFTLTLLIFSLSVFNLAGQSSEYESLLEKANSKLDIRISNSKTQDLFNQCIEINPDDYRAYFGRAKLYMLKNMYEPALEDLFTVMALFPSYTSPYHLASVAYRHLNQNNEAQMMAEIFRKMESGGTYDKALVDNCFRQIDSLNHLQRILPLISSIDSITKIKMNSWLVKDQFESTTMYQERTSAENKSVTEKIIHNEALNEIVRSNPDLSHLSFRDYNADKELMTLSHIIFDQIVLNIPIDEAKILRDELPNRKITSLVCSINNNKTDLEIHSFSMDDGGRNVSYTYNGDNSFFIPMDIGIRFPSDSENTLVNQTGRGSDGKRLALIIGNADYIHGGKLLNPGNDATSMKTALEKLGFDVLKYDNLSFVDMRRVIDDFGIKLRSYSVGLFFYAGHGLQANGNNYLVPVDAKLETENDVNYNCVNTGRLLAKMEDARNPTNIIILDACRDNPFERSWTRSTQGKGLAFMNAPAGSIIAYATSPGITASDGTGANGLYTSAILRVIENPNQNILEMFQEVRRFVRTTSNGIQIPWESTSLEGNFYFVSSGN